MVRMKSELALGQLCVDWVMLLHCIGMTLMTLRKLQDEETDRSKEADEAHGYLDQVIQRWGEVPSGNTSRSGCLFGTGNGTTGPARADAR